MVEMKPPKDEPVKNEAAITMPEQPVNNEAALSMPEQPGHTTDISAGKDVAKEVLKTFEQMPPDVRKGFLAVISSFTQSIGPRVHPIFDKMGPEHVSTFLENMKEDDLNNFKFKSTNRFFYLAYAIITVIVIWAAVYYLLPTYEDILIRLLTILVAFVGGFGGGYGLGRRSKE